MKGATMNEILNQLSLQAGGSHYPTINPQLQQKFAELIVQECCNVLQNEDILHSGYGYNQGFLHKKIKEHFGIEQ